MLSSCQYILENLENKPYFANKQYDAYLPTSYYFPTSNKPFIVIVKRGTVTKLYLPKIQQPRPLCSMPIFIHIFIHLYR